MIYLTSSSPSKFCSYREWANRFNVMGIILLSMYFFLRQTIMKSLLSLSSGPWSLSEEDKKF